jgi:hypothetical protein
VYHRDARSLARQLGRNDGTDAAAAGNQGNFVGEFHVGQSSPPSLRFEEVGYHGFMGRTGLLFAALLAVTPAVAAFDQALDPQSLADAVNRAARMPQPAPGWVDLDGARRSAELIEQWLRGQA